MADPIQRLVQRLEDPTPLLKRLGVMMVARTKARFDAQGSPPGSWPPRRVPNVAGVLADLARGPNVKITRCDPRPANVDTGSLRRSIAYEVQGHKRVVFGSPLPYATHAQRGGPKDIAVTAEIKQNLAAFLKRWRRVGKAGKPHMAGGKPFGCDLGGLGWLFQREKVTINRLPRPYAFISTTDARDLKAEVARFVKGKG